MFLSWKKKQYNKVKSTLSLIPNDKIKEKRQVSNRLIEISHWDDIAKIRVLLP